MYRILICDDDSCIAKELKRDILKNFGEDIEEVILFDRRDKLEFYIDENNHEVNIIFMDIELDAGNGIDLARKIMSIQPSSQIIFISGYDNYYLDVYTVEHVYFLKKPICQDDLRIAFERALKNIENIKQKCFSVINKQGVHRIPFNEILFLENERRLVHVHTARETISYYGRFEDVLERLDRRFKKCHKSYIANIAKARELTNRRFIYETGEISPISRTYYNEVKDAFLEYLDEDDDLK